MKILKQRFEIVKHKFWIFSFRLAKKDFAWKAWNGAGVEAGAGTFTGAGADSNSANNFIFYFINLTNN